MNRSGMFVVMALAASASLFGQPGRVAGKLPPGPVKITAAKTLGEGGKRMAFSPDGKTLAVSGDKTKIALWDTASGTVRNTITDRSFHCTSVAFTPDSSLLIGASGNVGMLTVWDAATGTRHVGFNEEAIRTRRRNWPDSVRGPLTAAVSHDGRFAIAGANGLVFCPIGNPDAAVAPPLQYESPSGRGTMSCLTVSADGKAMAWVGGYHGIIFVHVALQGQILAMTIKPSTVKPIDLAFSPDGKMLAVAAGKSLTPSGVGGRGGGMGRRPARRPAGARPAPKPVAAPAAKAASIGSLTLWDVPSKRFRNRLAGSKETIFDILDAICSQVGGVKRTETKHNHGGKHTLSMSCRDAAGTELLRLVEVKVRASRLGGERTVYRSCSIPAPPAGTWRKVYAFNVPPAAEAPRGSLKYKTSIHCTAFSPDGRTVVFGGSDGVIRVADVKTRRVLATLESHTTSVNAVAFSPDGKTLASAGSNATKLWATSLWSAAIPAVPAKPVKPVAGAPKPTTPPKPTPPPVKPPKPVNAEAKATQSLKFAKVLLDSGRFAVAKKRLEVIIRDYPKTQAAAGAKKLLKSEF